MSASPPIIPRLPTPPSPLPEFQTGEDSTSKTRSFSHGSLRSLSDWEIKELEELHRLGGKRDKKDEPTKPIVVVLYVVALWLIFQILTRTDDMELFSPSTSRSSFPHSHSPSMEIPNYAHLPYSFPSQHGANLIQTPPPIPTSSNNSTWFGFVVGMIFYPFYFLFTILTIPLPLILNILYLLKELSLILLYPILIILKAFYRGFIATPAKFFGGILETFYPFLVFIGIFIGFGCFMGLSVGWIGKIILNKILEVRNNLYLNLKLKIENYKNKPTKKQLDKLRLERLFQEFDKQEQERESELEYHRQLNKTKTKIQQIPQPQHQNKKNKSNVLNIGHSDLRGTKKDERRERELAAKERDISSNAYDSPFSIYYVERERERERRKRAKHKSDGSSASSSSNSSKSNETITTPPQSTKTKNRTRTQSQSLTKNITFQDEFTNQPVVVGIRKRGGVREIRIT